MAQKIRQQPATSELDEFRAKEYFQSDVERALSLTGDVTVTVGSIAAGAIATVTVEVLGARPGVQQTVQVGPPAELNDNIAFWGKVSAKDQVKVYLKNESGGAIVLPEYTYGVRVMP